MMKRHVLVAAAVLALIPRTPIFAGTVFDQLRRLAGIGVADRTPEVPPLKEVRSDPVIAPNDPGVALTNSTDQLRDAVARFVQRMAGNRYSGTLANSQGRRFLVQLTAPPFQGHETYLATIVVEMEKERCTGNVQFLGRYSIQVDCVHLIDPKLRNQTRAGWGNIYDARPDGGAVAFGNTSYRIVLVLTNERHAGTELAIIIGNGSKDLVEGYLTSSPP